MILARLILVAACALGASQAAVAQSFPSKAVKFVMPAAPGSSPDRVSRLIAGRLGTLWALCRVGATATPFRRGPRWVQITAVQGGEVRCELGQS